MQQPLRKRVGGAPASHQCINAAMFWGVGGGGTTRLLWHLCSSSLGVMRRASCAVVGWSAHLHVALYPSGSQAYTDSTSVFFSHTMHSNTFVRRTNACDDLSAFWVQHMPYIWRYLGAYVQGVLFDAVVVDA